MDIQQLETIFLYANIGIIVTNHKGEITEFNRYAETEFGYTREEVLHKDIELLIPEQLQQIHRHHRKVYDQHPQMRSMGAGLNLQGVKKDGSLLSIEVNLSYYFANSKTFVIAFVTDISEKQKDEMLIRQQQKELDQLNSRLQKVNDQLEQEIHDRTKILRETLNELERSNMELTKTLDKEKELNELKSRFITMASHEFRTPLSTILSSSFLLEKYSGDEDTAKRHKHIIRIRNAVAILRNILEDFLSVDKLEEGLVQLYLTELNKSEFAKLITEIVNDMNQVLKPGQQIKTDCSAAAEVKTDKYLLKKILINLLSNAIKFSGENTTITISCQANEKGLDIAVADQGIGISKEDQQHLFERFFRGKNAINIQGTGLGLHIIAKYLALMGGDIRVQSTLEKGTKFSIHLPQQ